jgi:diguanylate cyclase (GGDEF)-like protein
VINPSVASRRLKRLRQLLSALTAISIAFLVGWIDLELGPSFSMWVLHLLPIGAVSWLAGVRAGLMMAMLSAALTLIDQIGSWPVASTTVWIGLWNAASVLAVFGFAAIVPGYVHGLLLAETKLARQDQLTHIPNKLSFTEQLPMELKAAAGKRTPITVGLVEVHGLQYVNERFGTRAGDQLLRTTAATLSDGLGEGNLVGRVGGTTFAFVLPGMGESAARSTLEAVREKVVRKIDLYDRPISLAIAAVSTDHPSQDGQDLLLDRTGWLLQSIKQDRTLHPFRVIGENEIQA